MPFADAVELGEDYVKSPPAYLLLRGFVGYSGGEPESGDRKEMTPDDVRALRAALGG